MPSEHFINRELSWLEFNRRVLEEARDASQPLMERVKFLAIFSSNLDEFFEVRVAGIKQQIESGAADPGPDGLSPSQVFRRIVRLAHELVEEQYALLRQELAPQLASRNIFFRKVAELPGAQATWTKRFFLKEVFPVLTPLAVDASHPFPRVLNKSLNILVRLRRPKLAEGGGEQLYSIVQVPKVVPRLILLPRGEAEEAPWEYLFASDLIKNHIGELFPGLTVEGAFSFRVTRNSELYFDDEEAENLLRTIEEELSRRARGDAVRLEVEAAMPRDFQCFLQERLQLGDDDLYLLEGPVNMNHITALLCNEAFARYKDRPFIAARPLPKGTNLWALLRKQDLLLHHPYESFDIVTDFIAAAADDPAVLAMKMTLYRTSGDSPIVAALGRAAANGKQVTVIVELKARFDEAANIHWARALEEAGAHVVYGVVGLKTHCKMLLIVRREESGLRRYVHLGTGNYHPSTARLYTDLGLLTARRALAKEAAGLFNALTGLAGYPGFSKLLVAPFDLANRFRLMIEQERNNAMEGKPAWILVKVNSLVDEELIRALYEASRAGVKIDLIVRGICCLRPGVEGLSETIRVISIVGRFLEHSRIYCFANGGKPQVYLGSADWMPRNLYRRVEAAFPVECPRLRREVLEEILPTYLNDRVKARELLADGTYRRLRPREGEPPCQAQLHFRQMARNARQAQNEEEASLEEAKKFTPIWSDTTPRK